MIHGRAEVGAMCAYTKTAKGGGRARRPRFFSREGNLAHALPQNYESISKKHNVVPRLVSCLWAHINAALDRYPRRPCGNPV